MFMFQFPPKNCKANRVRWMKLNDKNENACKSFVNPKGGEGNSPGLR